MSDFEETWEDCTVFGSGYEQQLSNRGNWRHRPLKSGSIEFGEEKGIGPWQQGPDPKRWEVTTKI